MKKFLLILVLIANLNGNCSLNNNKGQVVDISHSNGEIDFEKLVEEYDYIFIKGTEGIPPNYTGDNYDEIKHNTIKEIRDTTFSKENIKNICNAANKLKKRVSIASYHFISPTNNPITKEENGAELEAKYLLDVDKDVFSIGYTNCTFLEPIIDIEPGKDTKAYKALFYTNFTKKWLSTFLNEFEKKPILYFNRELLRAMNGNKVVHKNDFSDNWYIENLPEYKIWYANYVKDNDPSSFTNDTTFPFEDYLSIKNKIIAWQYTEKGEETYIKNNVDKSVICEDSTYSELRFIDIDDNKYKNDILDLKDSFNGFNGGNFRPDQNITRAEFLKILLLSKYKLSDINKSTNQNFTDVSNDDWFKHYIWFATEKNIVNGYDDKTFNPNKEINYPEALKIILGVYFHGFDFKDNIDIPPVSDWYDTYIETLSHLIKEKKLEVDTREKNAYINSISRGYMAHLLNRIKGVADNETK